MPTCHEENKHCGVHTAVSYKSLYFRHKTNYWYFHQKKNPSILTTAVVVLCICFRFKIPTKSSDVHSKQNGLVASVCITTPPVEIYLYTRAMHNTVGQASVRIHVHAVTLHFAAYAY